MRHCIIAIPRVSILYWYSFWLYVFWLYELQQVADYAHPWSQCRNE